MIRNIKNDKRYIGQTIQNPQKRLKQHLESAYEENRKIYNSCLSRAIRKYGIDMFEIGIIADDVPDEDLDLVEAHYIDMYNCIAPNGYNMSRGFNDSNVDDIKEIIDKDKDYSENPKVIIDDISDEDIKKFLEEL